VVAKIVPSPAIPGSHLNKLRLCRKCGSRCTELCTAKNDLKQMWKIKYFLTFKVQLKNETYEYRGHIRNGLSFFLNKCRIVFSVLWVQDLVLHLVFGGFGGATATATGRALIIFISGSFVGRTDGRTYGRTDRWMRSGAFNGQ